MGKVTVGQAKATLAYKKRVLERHSFDLNRNTDQDIIEYLKSVESLQGYIKQLIRDDMRQKQKDFQNS